MVFVKKMVKNHMVIPIFLSPLVKFKDITDDQQIEEDGFQFEGDGKTLNDVRNLK